MAVAVHPEPDIGDALLAGALRRAGIALVFLQAGENAALPRIGRVARYLRRGAPAPS